MALLVKTLLLASVVWTLWSRLFFEEVVPEIVANANVVVPERIKSASDYTRHASDVITVLLWVVSIPLLMRLMLDDRKEAFVIALSSLLVAAASFLIEGFVFRKLFIPFTRTIINV